MELEFQKNLDKQTGTYAERLLLDGLFFCTSGTNVLKNPHR